MNPLSRDRLFATPWTVTYQAPLSMGFYRQEYCSRLPFPSPGDLPNPGMERFGRSRGEGKGYPLQYSGLENSMDCTE